MYPPSQIIQNGFTSWKIPCVPSLHPSPLSLKCLRGLKLVSFYHWIILHGMEVPQFVYSFTYQEIFWLFPILPKVFYKLQENVQADQLIRGLNWRWFWSLGDNWQCLKIISVVTTGKWFWHLVQRPEMMLKSCKAQDSFHSKALSSQKCPEWQGWETLIWRLLSGLLRKNYWIFQSLSFFIHKRPPIKPEPTHFAKML